jgi:DNA polymerase zeta
MNMACEKCIAPKRVVTALLSVTVQYRVESMMLRLAKPMNYVAVSPSVQQRARMLSPECIPLNMEPRSLFYTHPVVVLDFQSLYPSIMIAYNYCFSTCLGRLQHFSKAQLVHLSCIIFI